MGSASELVRKYLEYDGAIESGDRAQRDRVRGTALEEAWLTVREAFSSFSPLAVDLVKELAQRTEGFGRVRVGEYLIQNWIDNAGPEVLEWLARHVPDDPALQECLGGVVLPEGASAAPSETLQRWTYGALHPMLEFLARLWNEASWAASRCITRNALRRERDKLRKSYSRSNPVNFPPCQNDLPPAWTIRRSSATTHAISAALGTSKIRKSTGNAGIARIVST